MKNLRMDIEDKLWEYFNSEPIIKGFLPLLNLISNQGNADNEVVDCIEVTDPHNPFVKLCNEIAEKYKLPFRIKIINSENKRNTNFVGCYPGKDFFYITFKPEILSILDLSEIPFSIEHEFGHYFLPAKGIGNELIKTGILELVVSESDEVRITILANMLSHISEYNADRFAVFATKDIIGYINSLRKQQAELNRINPNSISDEEFVERTKSNWQLKFIPTHPIINDRAEALEILQPYLFDPEFNIDKVPEAQNKMLELLCHKEFMEEYGVYYEELQKSCPQQSKF